MPTCRRFVVAALFAVSLSPLGCQPAKGPAEATRAPVASVPGMPRPYTIPREVPAAFHVDSPALLLKRLSSWSGLSEPAVLRQASQMAAPQLVALIADVDQNRGWTGAWINGQALLALPIRPDKVQHVAQFLAGKPPEGRFGAVRLSPQRPSAPEPTIAWLERSTNMLFLAQDERGIATARELPSAYGGRAIYGIVMPEIAARYGVELPTGKTIVTGTSIHDLEIVTEHVPPAIPYFDRIAPGAMTELLEHRELTAGASTKYADHEAEVRSLISKATRQVEQQNFLIRGTLQDLLRRMNSVLRSWNGRVLVAVGKPQHLYLGLGCENPEQAERAVLHLLNGLSDGQKLARSFGASIPGMVIRRNAAKAGNDAIHLIELDNVRGYVPAEGRTLVDNRGRIRIAMSFTPRAGGAMITIGPDATGTLQRWLGSVRGNGSARDLLAVRIAVAPAVVEELVELASTGRLPIDRLLRLSERGPETKLVVNRKDGGLRVAVRGGVGERIRSPRQQQARRRSVAQQAAQRRRASQQQATQR
jgi:hypothetical protein